ncbi:MAG: hypothetical protein ACJAT2_001876 [Bacteriovoracaceae bacterium]|jgi:hypothetical protein
MYKIVLLFLLPLCLKANEIPFQDFFNFIEVDQDSYFSPGADKNSCSLERDEEVQFNLPACVASICKNEKFDVFGIQTNPYMILACAEDPSLPFCKGDGYKSYYKDLRELRESISEYFPLEQDFVETRLRSALSFIKEPKNKNSSLDSLNLNLTDLFTFIFASPEFFEATEHREGGIDVKFKSIKKLKKKLRSKFNLGKFESRVAVKALRAIFEDSNSIFALEYFGVEFVLSKFLTKNEQKDPLASLRARKFQALEKIKRSIGNETIDPESTQGSLSDLAADKESLLQEVLALEALSKLRKSELKTLSKPNFTRPSYYINPRFSPDWSDPNNKEKFYSTTEHIENQLNFYDGIETKIDSHELNAYMMTIINSLEILPDETEVEKAKIDSKEYLESFFDSFGKEFSRESTKDIKSEVGSLHLNFPKTKKEYLKEVKGWLNSRKGTLLDYKKLKDLDDVDRKNEFLGRGLLQDLMMGTGASGGLNEFVEQLGVNPIPDLYLGAYNGIKVGPIAVKDFSNKGKQILAHELGHHVGHFMEKNRLSHRTTVKFKRTRECLAASHTEEVGGEVKMKLSTNRSKKVRWKENKYSEEDFADWIASKASDSNMACLFLKGEVLDIPNKDYFKNADKEDTHSSAVYRLLNIELNKKGKLPASCQTNRVKLCPKIK